MIPAIDERPKLTLDIELVNACPACGSARITSSLTNAWGGGYIHYSICLACGMQFLNPRMTDEQTKDYYAGTYRRAMYGPDGVDAQDLIRQELRSRNQVTLCGPYILRAKSHLEIGCSAGWLLHLVAAPRSIGVEPDVRYHRLEPACNYPMVTDEEELPEGETFDLISMSHSLEHMNHPTAYLANLIGKHAHAGTLVMVEVPNAEETIGALAIHHPLAFTADTLFGMFSRLGWRPKAGFFHSLSDQHDDPLYILAVFERRP